MRTGDRKQRWKSTCQIEGFIMLGIAAMLFSAGGASGITLGSIVGFVALCDFRSASRGWKMSDKRPPWADKHDALDTKLKKRIKEINK